jgi:hypothetical protein
MRKKNLMDNLTDTTYINYHFTFKDGSETHIPVTLSLRDLSYIPQNEKPKPSWTRLEFNQCENCKLKKEENLHCPIALNLSDIIPRFKDFKSYEKVLLRIETPERVYEKETPLQQGLGSLLGIIMVSSGCPTMSILRPMVRFHLPFATVEETVYRAASCYLLGQFFKYKKGGNPDWNLTGLADAYEEIQMVNFGVTDRLRSISKEDANANAVVVLDVFAKALPSSIFVELRDLEYLFDEIAEAV